MSNIGLRMVRENLKNLPAASLPEGFSFRTYERGDREVWAELYSAAEEYIEITPGIFDREFYGDELELGKRMLFLTAPGGLAVGTSTAWYDDITKRPELGRVHWVAIRPQFQGQRLGAALLRETLLTLRQLSHKSTYLMTSSARHPALSLYLRFGFVPEIESREQFEAWRELAELLNPEFLPAIHDTLVKFRTTRTG